MTIQPVQQHTPQRDHHDNTIPDNMTTGHQDPRQMNEPHDHELSTTTTKWGGWWQRRGQDNEEDRERDDKEDREKDDKEDGEKDDKEDREKDKDGEEGKDEGGQRPAEVHNGAELGGTFNIFS